ncbi:homoserine kinase [Tepidimonas charontis]|uniref:Homoserine kinase n=1 Tax=Tepidimonas charontis TaxID=2267262 RepID=A0A554XL49_9BURK|nr:homoserine kinase [Tepidimonas charontis]TSE36528.1 Homoserine kinase [Tepidimonas charontis]
MAVFTEVSRDEAADLMQRLGLGRLIDMAGCAGGIENTNYFVSTEREGQRLEWVLTLFERLSAEQLPFYLHLMKHLAGKGIPVPDPQADAAGAILHTVKGKPAAVVNRLQGASVLAPEPAHCAQVGAMLARMHLAARDYDREQPNLRGLAWWNETVPVILPHLQPEQARLLQAELAYQNHIAASPAYQGLPRGPVHADLFRDNVMFDGERLSGVFDFYFAGCDTWLFDLAVCLNDWCIDLSTGAADPARTDALLDAYEAVRPLTASERQLLPALRRAGALRFWISRLWDWYLPRQAAVLKPHDPAHFERVLRARLAEC